MKYIAFDIEAANGFKADSICSIGIVVANEHLHVVHRENIWVNPKCKYNLNGTRANIGIDLHLDKKLLSKSPDFAHVYDKVCSYLMDKDAVILGHAVDSDIRMLNAACKRYKLPSINCDFVCTQLLYRLHTNAKEVRALGKIADDLQLTFEAHNSQEDAWMSMKTLEYVVKASGKSLQQLLEQYCIVVGNNDNFVMRRCITLQGANNRKLSKMASDSIRSRMAEAVVVDDSQADNVYALARTIELMDIDRACDVMASLASHGAKYTSKLNKCTHFVTIDNINPQDVMRQKRAVELEQQELLQIIDFNDLVEGN